MTTSPTSKREEECGLKEEKDGGESIVEIKPLTVSEDSKSLAQEKGSDEITKDENIDLKCKVEDGILERENVQGELHHEVEMENKSKVQESEQIIRNDDSSENSDEDLNVESKAQLESKSKVQESEQIIRNDDSSENSDEDLNVESKAQLKNKSKVQESEQIIRNDDSSENSDEDLNPESKIQPENKSNVQEPEQIIRNDDSSENLDEDLKLESKTQLENLNSDVGKQESGVKLNSNLEHGNRDMKLGSAKGDTELETTESEDVVLDSNAQVEVNQPIEEVLGEEKTPEPVFDGTEVPGMEAGRSASNRSLDVDSETHGVVDKAVALKNFVKEKSVVAVSSVFRRLSGKKDEGEEIPDDETKEKDDSGSNKENETKENPEKTSERSAWNPLNYIKISRDADSEIKTEHVEEVSGDLTPEVVLKGRIILYTRLGCPECKEARLFFFWKRLRYIEINTDVYPSRKLELEKIAGSSAVPKVFFNEILIGGLTELKRLDECGELNEKIEYLKAEAPSFEAPLPPLSGEDDVSSSGTVDELAMIVRKMKEAIVVKDRFYKMRRFTNCFLGSEAVDFLSEDQYLEREEAIEFGRKLAGKLFFQHVHEENLFEDGSHLYRFMDDDPVVSTQCHNIARGIIEVKPKPITDIASRLRFLSFAIFEAYVSEDGKHVDYRSIHGSEEFARYLRIVEELQRVEIQTLAREEKLAFFINLYNMMAIHAILICGHPIGALERRKLFGDFKYVIGGATYSLSAIQNGILRGNQRPPYNLMKPFGAKDKRSKVALPYVEPLTHFALACGTRSGPALRCYSPGNIDQELMEAARSFLRDGGLVIDLNANTASVSMILKWFSIDFGKNEQEVLKHASNYLKPEDSQALLELLANSQLKVLYQPYDWGMNF